MLVKDNVLTMSCFDNNLCEKLMSIQCQNLTILSWVLSKLCSKNGIFPLAPMLSYPKLRHQSLSLSPVNAARFGGIPEKYGLFVMGFHYCIEDL